MNKEALIKELKIALDKIEAIKNKKAKYQGLYGTKWELIMNNDIDSIISEFNWDFTQEIGDKE